MGKQKERVIKVEVLGETRRGKGKKVRKQKERVIHVGVLRASV